jgi:hypothetical protein
LIDINSENRTLEVHLWNQYKKPFIGLVKGFIERYALKCADQTTYYELNYDNESTVICRDIKVSIKGHFRKLYDYTDFYAIGYSNSEIS